MNRDRHLQRLLLLNVRDGKEPPDLANYPVQQQVHNSALLIQEGYVLGHIIPNSSGISVATKLTELTSKGHDFLDETDPTTERCTSARTTSASPEGTASGISPFRYVSSL